MIRALLLTLLVGCLHDRYQCTSDQDCDLGQAGRCEADHHCTVYDASCEPTLRRYTDHSEQESGSCFDGRVTPLDYCAAGQPPAPETGCAKTVCATQPACCTSGWSETCALAAQLQCPEVVCDTRVAITAPRGATHTELYDVRYDGKTWTATLRADLEQLVAWAAPAPGTVVPRLLSFSAADTLVLEDGLTTRTFAVDPDHAYHDAQSLDFDRDLRDTLVLEWAGSADPTQQGLEILKLATGLPRELTVTGSSRMAWGASNADGYPDGVTASGARYNFLLNDVNRDTSARQIDFGSSSYFNGDATPGTPQARSFSWADLDGDTRQDLVAFGNSIRVHTATDTTSDSQPLGNTAFISMDCLGPSVLPDGSCNAASEAWAGSVLPNPRAPGAAILAAPSPDRALYKITMTGAKSIDVVTLPLPVPSSPSCKPAPGPNPCAIQAVVVRDLDGDHLPDILAIDGELTFDVALSSQDATLRTFHEIKPIMPVNAPLTGVRTSVSGAPR